MVKNDIPRINAEKNTLALEQAQATLKQLKTTYDLKRKAAEADIRILKIRRDRAETRCGWRNQRRTDGHPLPDRRNGRPQVDLEVEHDGGGPGRRGDPRRRADRGHRRSEHDARARASTRETSTGCRPGRPQVGLDAYPELHFPGKVAQISPLGVMSNLSNKVRAFVVLIDIEGSHPNLMPDLTASLDVELARTPAALVVPLDAVRQDGERAFVSVQRGSGFEERQVTLGRRAPTKSWSPPASSRSRRGAERGEGRAMKRLFAGFRRPRNVALAVVTLAVVAAGAFAAGRGSVAPDLPTAEVKKGEFVDTLEIRGDIRPLKSIVLASPMQSGDLQIVKLAKNGSTVKAGDVVAQFDGSMLKRTIQEKQTELRQADAEIEQARSQGKITGEQNTTALMKARYDIERAKLDLNKGDTVSRIDNEKAKLTLADAGQRLLELEEKVRPTAPRWSRRGGAPAQARKAIADLQRAERGLQNLELQAPVAGLVNILPNFGRRARGAASRNSGRATVRGRAPRSWNCRTSRPVTSKRGSTSPIAGGPDGPGRDRPDRGHPRPRVQGPHQQHLGAGQGRFHVGMAAAEELRSQSRPDRRRSQDSSGDDRGGPHRDRAHPERGAGAGRSHLPAGRRAECAPPRGLGVRRDPRRGQAPWP